MDDWRTYVGGLHNFLVRNEMFYEIINMIDREALQFDQSVEIDDLFKKLIRKMETLFDSDSIQIVMTHKKKLRTAASSISDRFGFDFTAELSACGYVIQQKQSQRCEDIANDPIFKDRFLKLNQSDRTEIQSFIASPIVIMDSIIGVIYVESPHRHHFDAVQLKMLDRIANQLAVAIKQANIIPSDSFIKKIYQHLSGNETEPEKELYHLIGDQLKKSFDVDFVQILVYSPGSENDLAREYYKVVYNDGRREIGNVFHVNESICGRAIRNHKTFYSGSIDISTDPDYICMAPTPMCTELVVPISLGKIAGRTDILGVLNFENPTVDAFDAYLRFRLERFAQQIAPHFLAVRLREELNQTRNIDISRKMILSVADMSANLIHRLNNTVGAIKANALIITNTLEKSDTEGKEKKEMLALLKDIVKASTETLRIPEELKERLTDDSPKDVLQTISEVIAKFSEKRLYQDIHFCPIETPHSQIPRVQCPSLYYVLENIVKNSLDAMLRSKRDVKKLETMIGLQEFQKSHNRFVIIKIADTGVGIPKHRIDKIFEMAFADHKLKKNRGLGFGLTWAKTFVDSIGGEIKIESQVDRGTDVFVKLPIP